MPPPAHLQQCQLQIRTRRLWNKVRDCERRICLSSLCSLESFIVPFISPDWGTPNHPCTCTCTAKKEALEKEQAAALAAQLAAEEAAKKGPKKAAAAAAAKPKAPVKGDKADGTCVVNMN